MRKAIPMFTLLVLLFSSTIIGPYTTFGATDNIKQVEKDRKQVKNNLSDKEKQIVEVLEDIESLHNDINKLEKELVEHNEHIAETEEKVVQYEEEFQELVDEINELNTLIESRTEILNKQLVAYQENGGDISYLEVLFNAKSFLDFISRVTSVSTITKAEQKIIEEQIDNKNEIEELQDTIIEKIEKQEELIDELEETKTNINEKQSSLKKSEKNLKEKEASLKKEKEKLTKEDNDLKQLEKTYRDRMKSREAEHTSDNKVTKTSASNSSTTAKETSGKTSKPSKQNKPSSDVSVGKTFKVEATAYTPYCNGCSGITATGINVKNDKTQKIIAVDPNVIPLGSRVWVEGYGEAIAGDTGGAIKGNRIDVLYKSKSAALQWGRRTVTVKILD